MRATRPVIERLMERVVENESGCWVFGGTKTSGGYGVVGLGRRGAGVDYVHRVTYRHFVGEIPSGLDIDHLCRVRACCNPDHLEAVTRQVNLLRGTGPTAINATKTHCKRGHEFTTANTRHDGKGRQCRACDVIRYEQKRAIAS